jgi:hypothetical protein
MKSEATKQKESARRRGERLKRPAGCREYMRRELAKEFPGIMEGFVKAAKTGSVPHVKLATELLKPTRKTAPRRDKTVAQLLDKLKRHEPFELPPETRRWANAEDRGPGESGT